MTDQKYNICIISFYFPPNQNARAFRWGNIVSYLENIGHNVNVISPHFNKKHNPQVEATNSPQGVTKSWAKSFLWRYAWPDLPVIWVPQALWSFVRQKTKPDVFITVAMPFSTHITGLIIKCIFPKLAWVADIGDPISLVKNDKRLYPKLDKFLEQMIIKQANATSVTTRSLQKAYTEWIPKDQSDKIKHIPPLMPNLQFNFSTSPPKHTKALNLGFFGTLYGNIRNPSWCFQLLAKISKQIPINLYIVGLLHECEKELDELQSSFNGQVLISGPKSRLEIFKMYNDMDFLINIGNSNVYQLPSKVIEYIWTGKPILNFCHSSSDSSFEMFEELKTENVIHIFESDIAKNESILTREIPQKRGMLISDQNQKKILNTFSIESVTKKYLDAIDFAVTHQ